MTAVATPTTRIRTDDKSAYDPENPPRVPVKADKIATNHVMLVLQYVKVGEASSFRFSEPSAELTDLHLAGVTWTRRGRDILEAMYSADQFDPDGIVELPKTQLVQRLMAAGKLPFTVTWIKQDGSERTLRGRLIGTAEHELGYSWVEDLDLPREEKGGRMRQVDHRTIQSMIVDGVKYVLKDAKKAKTSKA